MKQYKKYIVIIREWFSIWLMLFKEIIYFFVNMHSYLYKFFSGLRLFSESYDCITNDLKERRGLMEQVKSRDKKTLTDIQTLAKLIADVELSKKEQQKIFTGLFGILIAVLALFISVLAVLIRR